MKEILCVVISIIFTVISCIFIYYCCTEDTVHTEHDETGVFVEIEDHLSYDIVYDKDTRVIYAKSNSGTNTFCPLYNADGTLKVYEENDNE